MAGLNSLTYDVAEHVLFLGCSGLVSLSGDSDEMCALTHEYITNKETASASDKSTLATRFSSAQFSNAWKPQIRKYLEGKVGQETFISSSRRIMASVKQSIKDYQESAALPPWALFQKAQDHERSFAAALIDQGNHPTIIQQHGAADSTEIPGALMAPVEQRIQLVDLVAHFNGLQLVQVEERIEVQRMQMEERRRVDNMQMEERFRGQLMEMEKRLTLKFEELFCAHGATLPISAAPVLAVAPTFAAPVVAVVPEDTFVTSTAPATVTSAGADPNTLPISTAPVLAVAPTFAAPVVVVVPEDTFATSTAPATVTSAGADPNTLPIGTAPVLAVAPAFAAPVVAVVPEDTFATSTAPATVTSAGADPNTLPIGTAPVLAVAPTFAAPVVAVVPEDTFAYSAAQFHTVSNVKVNRWKEGNWSSPIMGVLSLELNGDKSKKVVLRDRNSGRVLFNGTLSADIRFVETTNANGVPYKTIQFLTKEKVEEEPFLVSLRAEPENVEPLYKAIIDLAAKM